MVLYKLTGSHIETLAPLNMVWRHAKPNVMITPCSRLFFHHAKTTTIATATQKIAHAQNTAAHGLGTTQPLNFFIAPSPLCVRASNSGAS